MSKFAIISFVSLIILISPSSLLSNGKSDTTALLKTYELKVDYSLTDRVLESYSIPVNQDFEEGEFVLSVSVNPAGNVIKSDFLARESSHASEVLIEYLKAAANSTRFSIIENSSDNHEGTIKYVFKTILIDTIFNKDSTSVLRKFHKDSTLYLSVEYKSFKPLIRHGKAIAYYDNGKPEYEGTFYRGVLKIHFFQNFRKDIKNPLRYLAKTTFK